ncbi:MAG TPA: anti-sigma factor, partial [Pilimelia sp.]|nr:anti-sigma factor [Pilimelia sp.]
GAPRTGGGRVTLVVSPSRDAAVALLTGLPDPGAGKAYQMWVIDGTEATSAGVLAAGETSARWLLAGVRGADAFGVTVEPAGGSGKPTLPVAVAVPL